MRSEINNSNIKLVINSGIISQINEQILSSFSDFIGFLLGKYKLTQQLQGSDSESYCKKQSLYINIDNVIFIHDKDCLKTMLPQLIQNTQQNYSDSIIVGLFSGKSYSFPKLSLKEQELYMKMIQLTKSDNSIINLYDTIPLLFGAFSHNITTEMTNNQIKMTSFMSKVYYFDKRISSFLSLPYSIINMKETTYANIIDPIANKITKELSYNKDTNLSEKEESKLLDIITTQLKMIELNQFKEMKKIKIDLKNEIKEFLEVNKQLRLFNK